MTLKLKKSGIRDTYSVDLHYSGSLVQYQYPAYSRTFAMKQDGYTGPKPTFVPGSPRPVHSYELYTQSLELRRDFRVEQNVEPRLVLVDDTGYIGSTGPSGEPSETFVTITPKGISWLDLDELLYNKALDRLNDQSRGSLDLSVDIAEGHQTLKMFRVTDQVLDLTRTFTRKWGALKAPASAWLQYTYGIKPLCSTIHGLAEESLRYNLNRSKLVKGRATEEVEIDRVHIICPDQTIDIKATGALKASCTIGVDMLTQDFDISRFTSLNPISIAWELMPYSFVVDWFLNVGGYLRQLETAMLYASRFRSGYRTKLAAGRIGLEQVDTTPAGSWEKSRFDRIHGSLEITHITRTPLSSYPAPTFPSLKAQLGSSRLLSAASLLANMLGRRH